MTYDLFRAILSWEIGPTPSVEEPFLLLLRTQNTHIWPGPSTKIQRTRLCFAICAAGTKILFANAAFWCSAVLELALLSDDGEDHEEGLNEVDVHDEKAAQNPPRQSHEDEHF